MHSGGNRLMHSGGNFSMSSGGSPTQCGLESSHKGSTQRLQSSVFGVEQVVEFHQFALHSVVSYQSRFQAGSLGAMLRRAARATSVVVTGTTELLSTTELLETSGQTNVSFDKENVPPPMVGRATLQGAHGGATSQGPRGAAALQVPHGGTATQRSISGTTNGPARTKARAKKVARAIVGSIHLSTLVAAYNVHFPLYCEGRTKVSQVIPVIVWRNVYLEYQKVYPVSPFQEETLKERLRESLKELETGTSNEKNSETVTLQSTSVLERLRFTTGHAKRNVLQRRQSIMDCTPIVHLITPPGSPEEEIGDAIPDETIPVAATSFVHVPAASRTQLPRETPLPTATPIPAATPLPAASVASILPKQILQTKAQMLHNQSTSISHLCKSFTKSCSKRDALIDLKLGLNAEKQKRARIDSLLIAKTAGVISEEKFKETVKGLLDL